MNESERVQVKKRPPFVRILALNGGGARCWSALLILEEIMRAVSRRSGVAAPLPCEYFHLIVGSEWGAILAVLLGRLRLSIKECLNWLQTLAFPYSSGVFRIFPIIPSWRSKYYKQRFRELVKDRFPDSGGDLSFYDHNLPENHALTMALATDPMEIAKPKRFRSYRGDAEPDMGTPIWQVALAAIATPLDLDPVTFPAINTKLEYTCIASSLAGFSNPSWISLIEGQDHFDPNSVHAVLNIGCGGKVDSWWAPALGHSLPVVRGLALTRMVIGQVNDPTGTVKQVEAHQQMLRESANTGLYYQYFSVPTVTTSYYDWSKDSRKRIQQRTETYLDTPEIGSLIKAAAEQLVRLKDLPVAEQGASIPSIDPSLVLGNRRNPCIVNIEEGVNATGWLSEFQKTLDLVSSFDEPFPPVRLAILDTGIDDNHPWISKHWKHQSDMRFFYDFTKTSGSEEAVPIDETGHGTHMAGLILQIAPDVDLYVLRVFTDRQFDGDRGKDAMERVRKAIFFSVDTLEVNIISMPFAFEGKNEHALDDAITRAMEKNVVMFAAASNSGHHREDPYPANDRRVFRVNAVDEFGNRMKFNPPAGTDNNNDNLAILGGNLVSTWPMHLSGGREEPGKEGNWRESSGTSCSTALLSGICALTMGFGRILRARPEFRANSREAMETWAYVDKPQGMRYLFWQMANGRNNRTSDQFSDVRPWRLLSTDKNISGIGKLYLDALQLGKDGMG